MLQGVDLNNQKNLITVSSVLSLGISGLVVGGEGAGVSRLVKETCDLTVSIPMKGQIDSLNASVAAGILAFEVMHQRDGKRQKQDG